MTTQQYSDAVDAAMERFCTEREALNTARDTQWQALRASFQADHDLDKYRVAHAAAYQEWSDSLDNVWRRYLTVEAGDR